MLEEQSTPLPIVANVSRVVTKVVDRISGDRSDSPLLLAAVCVEALATYGIEARIMYGPAAWIEILEHNHAPVWAGCWGGENLHFWVATAFGEVVDLNVSVAHRKRSHAQPDLKAELSAPMLWSREVPAFYRYKPEGVAEIELQEESDRRKLEVAVREVKSKCGPAAADLAAEPEFPNEPILCPGRKVLDDASGTFKQFERALGIHGLPPAPI